MLCAFFAEVFQIDSNREKVLSYDLLYEVSNLLSSGVPRCFDRGTLFSERVAKRAIIASRGVRSTFMKYPKRSKFGVVATQWVVLTGMLIGAAGCQDVLFTPEQPRSQYDRFDAVRDRRAQTYVYDEFGNRRPNIRARLLETP